MPPRHPIAWRSILPFALVEFALLVATANRYGYHRDELYFREAARHPAFGYDDQPALTPLLGWMSEALFGDTPRGLRMVSGFAMALAVPAVNEDAIESIGWPRFVEMVGRVWRALPERERRSAVIFAGITGRPARSTGSGRRSGSHGLTRVTTRMRAGASHQASRAR